MAETLPQHQANLDRARFLLNYPENKTLADVEMLAANMLRLDGLLVEMLDERDAVRSELIRLGGITANEAYGLTAVQLLRKVLTPGEMKWKPT